MALLGAIRAWNCSAANCGSYWASFGNVDPNPNRPTPGFPCCVRFPCVHAAATTPVQQMGVLVAQTCPIHISLPRFHYRVGLHIVLFEVCSAFTRVAACTLAQSPNS